MVKLSNGETIFERQIRLLSECGINDFVVTTGYLKEQLIAASRSFPTVSCVFVDNPDYEITNYIYSMHLARAHLNDDILLLHGDLVFNKRLIVDILQNGNRSLCLYNEEIELPEKNFKGRIQNGLLKEISVDIFDDDCYTFQPLYRFSKKYITLWMDEIERFVNDRNIKVYAENALNNLLNNLNIKAFSYKDYYVDEIDNADDYREVSNGIRYYDYMEQEIYSGGTLEYHLCDILKRGKIKKIFLVASESRSIAVARFLQDSKIKYILFSGFSQNPSYEEIKEGVDLYKKEKCDFIISIGGGSCIDTAKCIKLFSTLSAELDFLKNKYNYSSVKHLAIPTTAGTGSESTRFAVAYYNNEKQSISHDSILPEYVILDYTLLYSLPEYYKKTTMLDALCQAIESYWSKKATVKSREYSINAITQILSSYDEYMCGDKMACKNMLLASNFSGKAINLTATTAPHAMSYKLTSLYGISHGHAVGLCLPYVWEYMYNKTDSPDVLDIFLEISKLLECDSIREAITKIEKIYCVLKLPDDFLKKIDVHLLASAADAGRLSNSPVELSTKDIVNIYRKMKQKA